MQCHPEETHAKQGGEMPKRLAREICSCDALWTSGNIIDDMVALRAVETIDFMTAR